MIEINNFACHAAGYVVNGPEMFVWAMLGAYYQQQEKVEAVTKTELVNCLMEHPSNTHSKRELEKGVDWLAGAGRNGPIKLPALLAEVWDGSLLPTRAFGIMLPKDRILNAEPIRRELPPGVAGEK